MKLKSLNLSFLTDSDILKLNLANIQTTEQLITHADLEALSRQTGIPSKNLRQIKKYIIGQYSPFPEQANVLLDKYIKKLFIVETGCAKIDDLISNGFYSSEISEISGASSTGKTQLCFQLIVNMLAIHPDFSCLYIDSNNNFCPKRVRDLIDHKFKSTNEADHLRTEKRENILKSIKVVDGINIFNLIDILFKITKSTTEANKESFLSTNLLIIDNFTTLFNQFKQNSYLEVNFHLNYISSYLKYLANTMKMMILIVSNRSSNEAIANSFNLTNSPNWVNTPNLIVCLKNVEENEAENKSNIKKFEILKRNRPFLNDSNKSFCYFSITQSGFV